MRSSSTCFLNSYMDCCHVKCTHVNTFFYVNNTYTHITHGYCYKFACVELCCLMVTAVVALHQRHWNSDSALQFHLLVLRFLQLGFMIKGGVDIWREGLGVEDAEFLLVGQDQQRRIRDEEQLLDEQIRLGERHQVLESLIFHYQHLLFIRLIQLVVLDRVLLLPFPRELNLFLRLYLRLHLDITRINLFDDVVPIQLQRRLGVFVIDEFDQLYEWAPRHRQQ